MNTKEIETKYKPLPFWSWNERLEVSETKRQIGIMNEAHLGGFFMHARAGLKTKYMSEEWFENVKAGIEEAEKYGMEAWAYDENGYPSGFGDGKINALGEEYRQKNLCCEKVENSQNKGTEIIVKDGYRFYYETNPYYVDLLNENTTKEFIKNIYEPYYERFKNKFSGFFTDEPNMAMFKMPWSNVIPKEYQNRYGEDIKEKLIELFEDTGDYKNTRIKFRKLITDLFSKNYFKQIYDWCDKHGLKLTGHILLEESLNCQIDSNGSSMAHYEYFHIPGVDKLSRPIAGCLLGKQVSSVACQLGKKQVITESFACAGHELDFTGMKRILESQFVRGVNRFCSHLEGYSLRGDRKRDNPPAMYYQQPWWDDYKDFCDCFSRIGKILSEGEEKCDVLLIHPLTKAWEMYNGNGDSVKAVNEKLNDTLDMFEKKHIMFHLGDETIIERHGKIENDKFVVGNMKYDKVIVLYDTMLENTKKLLAEYEKNGGKIVNAEDLEKNSIIDNENITYTKREFEDCVIHYFVNLTDSEQKTKIQKGEKILDYFSGEWSVFSKEHTFFPYESIMIKEEKEKKNLDLSGKWKIKHSDKNIYTLDFCRYYINGELQEKRGYVLNILYRAMKKRKKCRVDTEFFFEARYIPEELYMLSETPGIFDIFVNDKKVEYKDEGWYIDTAFKKTDISSFVKTGINKIRLSCDFAQSEEVYKTFEASFKSSSMQNKLSYDTEIEPIYLMGDFGVYTEDKITVLEEKDAFKIDGNFYIDKPQREITLKNIEKQGYLFFAGKITVEKELELEDVNYILKMKNKGINSVKVNVNGNDVSKLIFAPFEADISQYLKKGKNKIQLTITNNLRNMLGPHHFVTGTLNYVAPPNFFKETSVWYDKTENDWNEEYCFIDTSLF